MLPFSVSGVRVPCLLRTLGTPRSFCSVGSCKQDVVASKGWRYDPGPTVFGSRLFWAERRKDKYMDLLRRVRMKHPGYMVANGQRISLPHRLECTPLIESEGGVPDHVLQSLATYFGECGTISCETTNYIVIRLSQKYDRCERLLQFQQVFGGLVRNSGGQQGGCAPRCRLQFGLARAKTMIKTLSKFSSSKSEQLNAILPFLEKRESVSHIRSLIKSARSRESCGSFSCAESFASFFDRRGSVSVHPYGKLQFRVFLRSESCQREVKVFLQNHRLPFGCFSFRPTIGTFWQVSSMEDILILCRFLQPHVITKKSLLNDILQRHDQQQASFLSMRNPTHSSYWYDRSLVTIGSDLHKSTRRLKKVKCTIQDWRNRNQIPPQRYFDEVQVLLQDRHEQKADVFAQNVRKKIRHLLDGGACILPK